MDAHYIDLVKEWVKLDNIVTKNTIEVKEIKDKVNEEVKAVAERVLSETEKKKEIEKDIIEYVQDNKLDTMQLKISDGVITFGKKITPKPITQKWLREILQKYGEEHPNKLFESTTVIEYILSNIEKKVDYSINRTIKDQS